MVPRNELMYIILCSALYWFSMPDIYIGISYAIPTGKVTGTRKQGSIDNTSHKTVPSDSHDR